MRTRTDGRAQQNEPRQDIARGKTRGLAQRTPRRSTEIGREKEEMACRFLTENEGYRVIERNYRCKYGEIDVIAVDGNVLAFVEVRYRRDGSLVSALESVDRAKAAKLRLAVRRYISSRDRSILLETQVRVDLCLVKDGNPCYELIKGIIEF